MFESITTSTPGILPNQSLEPEDMKREPQDR